MKRKFKLLAGFDITIDVEVDLEKLTPALALEINNFWSGADDVLRRSGGDIIVAATRRAAPYFIGALLEGLNKVGAQANLDESEEWPDNHGITLIDFEVPEFSAYDVDVEEIHA